jgi:hypothetical protein
VVAIVESEKIYYNDYKLFADKQNIEINEHNRNFILDNLVAQKILLLYAQKSEIRKEKLEPGFLKEKEYLKKKILIDKFFEIESTKVPAVTANEARHYYKTHIFYTIRAINFEKQGTNGRKSIDEAYRKLDEGERFVDVYKQMFPYEKDSKLGLVGIIDLDDMTDELKKNIMSLKKDGTYTPIIETPYFYSIYYRDSYPTFSEAKEYIVKKLYKEKVAQCENDLTKMILNSISLNYLNIKKIKEDSLRINAKLDNEFLAVSNLTNGKLYRKDFFNRLSDLYKINNITRLSDKELNELTKAIFTQQVIYDYAIQKKLDEDFTYKKELALELKKLEEMQAEYTIKYLIENVIILEKPSEEEINQEYYSQSGKYRKSDLFKLQEIYISKREIAIKVDGLARQGYNFDELVKRYSEDPDAGYTKGITFYLNENDLGPEYKTFYKYNTGDVSPMRQDIEGKYIVTRILDRQAGATPPLESMRNEIISRLMYERLNGKLEEICDEYSIYVRKYYDKLNPSNVKKVRQISGWK